MKWSNRDVTFNQGRRWQCLENTIQLNNQMAIVAEISYHSSPEKLGTLEILGTQDTKIRLLLIFNDKYLVSGRSSSGRMSTDAFRKISMNYCGLLRSKAMKSSFHQYSYSERY